MRNDHASPTHRASLDEAVQRLGEGDRGMAARVFEHLWPALSSFCVRTLGAADGEDAAQTAIIKVFEQAADYDCDRPALSWALSIAAWECRTVLTARCRRRVANLDEAQHVPSGGNSPEDDVLARELVEAAVGALERLSADERAAVVQALEAEVKLGPTERKRKERALPKLRRWLSKVI